MCHLSTRCRSFYLNSLKLVVAHHDVDTYERRLGNMIEFSTRTESALFSRRDHYFSPWSHP